ncbi:MAG: hypothetical protein AAFU77_17280 [Myxococcota bacterium]
MGKDPWPVIPTKTRNRQHGSETSSLHLLPNGQLYTVSTLGRESRFTPGCDDLEFDVDQQLDIKLCLHMDVSSDGQLAVLGGDEIVVREIMTGKVRKRWDPGSRLWGLSLSEDRRHLVVSREPNIFDLYQMVNFQLVGSTTEGERCAQVRFVNNESQDILLATSFQGGSVIYCIDLAYGFIAGLPTGLDTGCDVIGDLEVSPNKQFVAYSDVVMRIGELVEEEKFVDEGQRPKKFIIREPRGPTKYFEGMLINSWSRPFWLTDRLLAASPPGGAITKTLSQMAPETFVFDVQTGKVVAQLEVREQVRNGFAFDRERSILYGACRNGDVFGWDVSGLL